MQEYWVNVYYYLHQYHYYERFKSYTNAEELKATGLLYRIHVKLKPKRIVKPNHEGFASKLDWMG